VNEGRWPATGAVAERLLRDLYGLEAQAESLPGEVDNNFLLRSDSGERYVLKISPEGTALEALECQVAVLRFLEATPLADLVPCVLLSRYGRSLTPLGEAGFGWVRVVSFLEGTPLARHGAPSRRLLREVGRTLARLDLALLGFDHPGTRRTIPWDLPRTFELGRLAEHIPEARRRALVERLLERFRLEVAPRLEGLEHSVIHNDANDHNLLVSTSPDRDPELKGLIDFGDMLWSVTVAELAIACAYLMLDSDDPLLPASHVVAGYDSARPLSRPERSVLFDLILARLSASVLMSARGRHLEPDNEYLQISERPVWRLLERLTMIDPGDATRALEQACGDVGAPVRSAEEISALRRRHLGRNLSVAYREPLKIVRGKGQYLFDDRGRRYLDLVNNVCHVGHCHPHVVAAAQRQMAVLNTNTRYLHDHLAEYALRLAGTFPEPLSVCFFVCTGTEANDLALRLARAHTGSREIVVLDHAYHGHSPSLVEISPYKCEGPGGEGLAAHAHKVPMPDPYRGPFRGPDAGQRYAESVRDAVDGIVGAGHRMGAFMAESLIGCGGQVIPAPGFLRGAFAAVREAGGVCIADEVQVGFGRVGSHMWAFETQGIVPEIVTLGKPIGNGHPMAVVITTPEIAASFETGMEYFNTFGGNPVSCAVGLAVLEVIEREGLQRHALELGRMLLDGLDDLEARHELIGDVRGLGLFAGVELVRDRATLEAADSEAAEVIESMKERGFLLSTDGPLHNVLKIKPPMVLQPDDVSGLLAALDEVLGRTARGGRR